MTNDPSRPPMTNAEKQAAFRERRKAEAEAMQRQLADLEGRLADEQAESAALRRQVSALAATIADLKGL